MVMRSADWTHFDIDAQADPGLLSRLLELFAVRNDVPAMVQAARVSESAQRIEICADGLDAARARVIAAKMQSLVGVWTVRLEQGRAEQSRLEMVRTEHRAA
jgi:acetolactate synthase small subunit